LSRLSKTEGYQKSSIFDKPKVFEQAKAQKPLVFLKEWRKLKAIE
jgi:hypothetical protein